MRLILLMSLMIIIITPAAMAEELMVTINTASGFVPSLAQYGRAQTFEITDSDYPYVTKVEYYLHGKVGSPSTITFRVVETDGSNKPDWTNYLAEENVTASGYSTGQYYNVTFTDLPQLSVGTKYAIAADDPAHSGSNYFILGASNSDQYANGNAAYNYYTTLTTSSAWNLESNSDLKMKLWMTDGVATINALTPLNNTYTYNTTPEFTFELGSVVGTWNTTLYLNGTEYGSNNSITTSGEYSIYSDAIPANTEYGWVINATMITDTTNSVQTDEQKLFIAGIAGENSCVIDLGNAYAIPPDCSII